MSGPKLHPERVGKLEFQTLVQNPTHIQGEIIDHCYISNMFPMDSLVVSQKSVYYTDHDIIRITMKHT